MNDTAGNIEQSDTRGARRYLTVLFADLVDSTRLGGTMEAETYADLIGAVRRVCRDVIPRHGGRIARLQGDGMLALFGLAAAQEDDGRRATEAALELQESIGRLTTATGERLAMHSGIHAGLVYVLDGDLERGRFEILGDVPNVAARLSALARAGEILVSEESLGPESQFFELGPREVETVKGYPAPLVVRRIIGRALPRRRFDAGALRGSAPFSGRSTECREVSVALQAARSGAPLCLAITGGPGIGKTRFVEEAVGEATRAGWTILRGHCENYLGATPMQPFLQMLRTLAAECERVGAPPAHRSALLKALEAANASPTVAPALRSSPVAAIQQVFELIASSQPLLLVLDDWQWADDTSRRILDALLALHRPVAVLIATRDDVGELRLPAARAIALPPLGIDEAGPAIRYLLPEADPFLVAEIHRYGGGNPLFIEELCHAARAVSGQRLTDRRRGGTAWLHALIESRVARLPPAQARLVRTAAVIGNTLPAWLLERITGVPTDDALVRSLADHDFVFPADEPGMLRFKHGITRDVVYDAVGLHERQALHRRIASALIEEAGHSANADDLLEPLAYHCAAGDMSAAAAMYAERAGDKALAAHALDRAQTQYIAVLHALDDPPPVSAARRIHWCSVAQKLGMACVFDALALTEGVAVFERAVALAEAVDDLGVRARAAYWLCYIHYTKGSVREAIRHGEAALALCERIDEAGLMAQVRATLGQSLAAAARYEAAMPLLDSAIDAKRARSRIGGSVAVGSAYALVCKGAVLGDRGLFAQADECFGEALALLGSTVHQVGSSVRNWISAVYLWQGRWDDALLTARESAQIAGQVRSRQLLAMSQAICGYAGWIVSGDPRELQAVREATSWVERRRGALLSSLSYGWLADGAVSTGDMPEVRRAAAGACAKARAGDPFGQSMAYRGLARAAAISREPARAEHYLARALTCARARGARHEEAVTQLCRASIEADHGSRAVALNALDNASELFERMQMQWHLDAAATLRRRL